MELNEYFTWLNSLGLRVLVLTAFWLILAWTCMTCIEVWKVFYVENS